MGHLKINELVSNTAIIENKRVLKIKIDGKVLTLSNPPVDFNAPEFFNTLRPNNDEKPITTNIYTGDNPNIDFTNYKYIKFPKTGIEITYSGKGTSKDDKIFPTADKLDTWIPIDKSLKAIDFYARIGLFQNDQVQVYLELSETRLDMRITYHINLQQGGSISVKLNPVKIELK